MNDEQKTMRELQMEFDEKSKADNSEYQAFDQRLLENQGINPYEIQMHPREYLHRFLLEAKRCGCSVDSYIELEIKQMLNELER